MLKIAYQRAKPAKPPIGGKENMDNVRCEGTALLAKRNCKNFKKICE